MNFWKINGAGNDFIVINGFENPMTQEEISDFARKFCERHLSIGADGVLYVDKSELEDVDFRLLYFNADGSLGELCGNGSRCICRYGYETGLSGENQRVETTAGIITGKRISATEYRTRLTDPSYIELDKKLQLDGITYNCDYIVLGDPGLPHVVIDYAKEVAGTKVSTQSLEVYPAHLKDAPRDFLRELGRKLRFHESLPKGANVNFIEIIGDDEVDEITFERGVEDFTYACGTGTASVGIALTLKDLVSGTDVTVHVPGGVLKTDIEEVDVLEDGSVNVHGAFITGPTCIVCKGETVE